MVDVTTRAGKGAPISATEHDNNIEYIVGHFQSGTAPTTPYASQLWADTTTSTLKMRNTANTAWITLGTLDDDAVFAPNKLDLTGGTLSGDLNFGDNVKANFGAGSDLQIYHDGSNSWIQDNGTGNLAIQTNGTNIQLAKSPYELMLRAYTDGAVQLFYDNAEKLTTTSTGVDVTGTVTADTLDVQGASSTVTGLSFLANTNGVNKAIDFQNTSGVKRVGVEYDNTTTDLSFVDRDGNKLMTLTEASGDISFYDDTGTTQAFFWDASTERLGIGTTTPAQLLELSGSTPSIRLNDNRLIAWTGGEDLGGVDFYTSDNSANGPLLGARISSVNSISSTIPDFNLAFSTALHNDNTGPVERMRITSSGKVGIGTTTPQGDLELSSSTPFLNISSTASQAGTLLGGIRFDTADPSYIAGDYPAYIYANDATANGSAFELIFGTTGADRMVIDNNGNVGIGESNPSTTLHVAGAVTVESSSPNIFLKDSDLADTQLLITQSNATAFYRSRGGTSTFGQHLFQRHDGTSVLNSFQIAQTGDILLYDDTGTEGMRWDASTQRLGIRTSSPDYPLDVQGNIQIQNNSPGLYINDTNSTTDNKIIAMSLTNGELIFQYRNDSLGGGGDYVRFTRSGNSMLGMEFVDNSNVKNFISNSGDSYFTSGKVGIGTSNPATTLHVSTALNVPIASESTDAFCGHILTDTGGSVNIQTANGYLRFLTGGDASSTTANNATEAMRIEGDGDFYVNTTNASLQNASSLDVGFTYNQTNSFVTVARSGLGHAFIANKTGQTTAQATDYIDFRNQGTSVGEITYDGTDVSIAQISDERLKENIVDAADSGAIIDALKVRSFDWKDGARISKRFGFVAQEVHAAFPEAAMVGGDNALEEPWKVNEAKLIPLLLKEIQSLRERVATLEGN